MHQEQEIEIKTLLTEKQFTTLRQTFFNQSIPIIQTNTYFDTPTNTLKKRNHALRTRQTEIATVLTLKMKDDDFTSQELTVSLQENLITTLANYPDFSAALAIPSDTLSPITTFTTRRYTCELPFGHLFLDQTLFEDDRIDFELEIELFSLNQINDAKSWLQKHHINHLQAKPKIARALAKQSVPSPLNF